MTSYEFADLAQSSFANATSVFAVFLSIVFAYIATAYLVGAELTRTQVRISTSLFLLVALVNIWSFSAYTYSGVLLVQRASPEAVGSLYVPAPWLAPFAAGISVFIVTMALKFMWDVRRPDSSESGKSK